MDSGEYRAEADLLHPLATLHWEHCHTWRDVTPTHCAVLHDRVAILTLRDGSSADVLHISSNDLHLWTTTTLPYQYMSLTTYQSMFVAVGGRHPSTNEPTDLLLSSDTGLQWQPSLPPMPTKRSDTSSVSTRSPEVLVVAGGRNSDESKLDVVELLLGVQWSTVDPLPAPCYSMYSTLHDGNLYFMGGEGQGYTVYTCSCTSLISSCGTNTTTDRPLWRQFKAPGGGGTAAASYSSRLVSIDEEHIIEAYSSVSQSWVEATSTRDSSHEEIDFMAAAVLPTGELVCAFGDGVYKVKLSVSSFNPDSWFMSNVLSRLEAVMGIQIVSALANNHSQLITTSGVQLREQDEDGKEIVLPDPQTDPGRYVEEVFFQWSAGHSHRLPTWRHLLEVLRDIGLLELSQQIDTFMKEFRGFTSSPQPTNSLAGSRALVRSNKSPTNDDVALTSSPERMLTSLGNSNLEAFMSVYADLVVAVEPIVNTLADHCHSMGLISKDVYDTIIQRDLIRADKARILLSSIRDAISRNKESLHQFNSALNKVGDFEYLVQKLEKHLSKGIKM